MIPISAVIIAKACALMPVPWPVDCRAIHDYRPNAEAPPRLRIPIATIVVIETRAPSLVTVAMSLGDVDPFDRLDK